MAHAQGDVLRDVNDSGGNAAFGQDEAIHVGGLAGRISLCERSGFGQQFLLGEVDEVI